MKDLFNLVHPLPAIAPVSVADNTPQVSAIIDRQGFNSLTFMIALGSIADADATFAVKLEHGSAANLSDAADVTAADLLGTAALAAFTYADDNKTRKIGYTGCLRYTRLTITPTGNAAAALVSAVALLGHPGHIPTANPPV
ncbi:MAG: hypothetical protein A3I66_00660 [Burkholderiales bacterium RIFCSPLOWO2_02_FULL_57_36]|nr:MAG: hypothetical protein A3I66_00660 [Burkholderiales bacterium RIFCSPLOWO2_02_FULL_57_36]